MRTPKKRSAHAATCTAVLSIYGAYRPDLPSSTANKWDTRDTVPVHAWGKHPVF